MDCSFKDIAKYDTGIDCDYSKRQERSYFLAGDSAERRTATEQSCQGKAAPPFPSHGFAAAKADTSASA